jgi:hypothetical protein
MKSYKEYLMESKKVYEFKIKIAGECPKDCSKHIKEALAEYKVESCSGGKSTPIASKQPDFPKLENVGATLFDVVLCYPTTSVQVREAIADKLKLAASRIRVRNSLEEEELERNHEYDEKSGESLLSKDYDSKTEGQDLVGEKHTMSLLKELGKTKKTLEQYKGVNDALLAKSEHKESSSADQTKINTKSPVGSKSVKKPTAKTVGV